ncbi:hypothetical protein DA2_1778 [Desulfovibrio sp. A2]|nr:hypothetical protein DA2_1778 [Desulfovibrio sp. A2]
MARGDPLRGHGARRVFVAGECNDGGMMQGRGRVGWAVRGRVPWG